MKKTWKILNKCMNKNKECSNFPKCFKTNDVEIQNEQDIANRCRDTK